jgi:DNA-binding CsgD family transcriptional regulator
MVCLITLLDGSALQSGFLGRDPFFEVFIYSSAFSFSLIASLPLFFFRFKTIAITAVATNSGQWMRFGGSVAGISFLAAVLASPFAWLEPTAIVFGALFGFGLSRALVFWVANLKSLLRTDAFKALSLCFLAIALLRIPLLVMPHPWPNIIFSLLLLLSSFLPYKNDDYAHAEQKESRFEHTKGIYEHNWILFTALIPYIVLVAFCWSGNIKGEPMLNNPQATTSWGIVLGLFLSGLFFLWITQSNIIKRVDNLYVILPISCVLSLGCSWFLGEWDNGLTQVLTNIPLGVLLASVFILLIERLSLESLDYTDSLFIIGLCCTGYVVLFLLCFLSWPLLGDQLASSVSLTVGTVYPAIVAIRVVLSSRADSLSVQTHDDMIEQRCYKLAEESALSKREREILFLLAQGRGAPYIAQNQFVSANTVRSHIKRIYAKLKIHSKEELLDLIHAVTD